MPTASPVRPSKFVCLVVVLGASYSLLTALLGDRQDSSSLWFLDAILVGVFLLGVLLRRRGRLPLRWRNRGRWAAFAYVSLSWLTGMTYELSLRTGATGFGGMHPDTVTSFVYAQGYYVPLAVGSWWLIQRFHYDFNWVFWTGCLAALYEMVTIGGTAVLGGAVPVILLPLLVAYYLTTYGLFVAMPLMLIDEHALWSPTGRPIRPVARAAIGVGFGLLLWAIFLAWATGVAFVSG